MFFPDENFTSQLPWICSFYNVKLEKKLFKPEPMRMFVSKGLIAKCV